MPIKREKFPKVVTPIGIAVFPRVNRPDTKFKKEGEYTCKLRLANSEAAKLIAVIERFHAEALEVEKQDKGRKTLKLADMPFKPATRKNEDGDIEPIPGFTDFSTKRKASGQTKEGARWTASIAIFDSQTPPQPLKAEVWGGSEVRLRVVLKPWYTDALGFGVQLELHAVQVIKLVTKGGTLSAQAYGFEGVEGGHVGSSEDGEEPAAPAADPEAAASRALDEF